MTDPPLPDSSELTRDDFIHSRWKEVIGDAPITCCADVDDPLRKASEKALEEGDLPQAKVFRLLAGACSMRLTNKSRSEPYEPMWVWNGRSSPTPDWFSESDINFLADILDDIAEPMLKGRLADVVWMKRTPREVKIALEAIDSYRSLDVTQETWVTDVGDCWKRALTLTRMLGTGAVDRIKEMEADLRAKLETSTSRDHFFGHWLGKTLKEFGLGKGEEETIAGKLEALADELEKEGNFHAGRNYYSLAGEWFGAADQGSKQTDMTIAVAEGYVKEAEARMSSDNPSALVAVGFYDSAIQTYREIPRAERYARQIDQRIAELIRLHEEAGKASLGEMKAISIPGADISKTVQQAKATVRGKTPIEALRGLASLAITDAKELRRSAQENLESYPFTALASWTMLTSDGRVAARRPGIIPGSPRSDENELAIWGQMIQDHGIRVDLAVRGWIRPALEILHVEHRFLGTDFITLARNSPEVPIGREELVGKALFYGYEYDFAIALHLLTPQIENMVRNRLKSAGVITTHTDSHGIEDEKGLSSLVEAPEFEQIFGQDLAFEIKALFCDHSGANLRNNVSHGLLAHQQCYSVNSIYAWWLGLKIVFNTYWRAYQLHGADQDPREDEPADPNSDTEK